MRRSFDPEVVGAGEFYRLTTSLLVPRPIAWVSTLSAEGVANLAPHSFFTCACVDPPVLQYTSVGTKDSLRNSWQTREFTISLCPEPLFERVNSTATDFPADQSEFERVGLELEPSERVAPPRVAASPAAFECELLSTQSFGNSTVVFGRVLVAAVDEDVLGPDGLAEVGALAPLARLGRNQWSTIGEVKRIDRIAYSDWDNHPGDPTPERSTAG